MLHLLYSGYTYYSNYRLEITQTVQTSAKECFICHVTTASNTEIRLVAKTVGIIKVTTFKISE